MVVRIVDKTDGFVKTIKKLDSTLKEKAEKQILKIIQDPMSGKPMRYDRKGTRERYVKPFRISYEYFENEGRLVFLSLYHKDEQ